MRLSTILVALLLAILAVSCGTPPELPPGEDSMTGREIESLEEWVELPARPTEVAWQVTRTSDPSAPESFLLKAFLSFEREDAERILAESPPLEPSRTVFVSEIPRWFPEEARRELESVNFGPAGDGYSFGEDNLSRASDVFDSVQFRGGHVVKVGDSEEMIYLEILSD